MNQLGKALIMFEVTDQEIELIKVCRKLKPYGKIEIARNQTGEQLSVTLTNPERLVIAVAKY